jgi:hypothetical protein
MCATILAVEDDHDLWPVAELVVDALTEQREEHELGGDVPLVGLVAAQDLRGRAEAGTEQQVVPVDQEQGNASRHDCTAFRNASAISAER